MHALRCPTRNSYTQSAPVVALDARFRVWGLHLKACGLLPEILGAWRLNKVPKVKHYKTSLLCRKAAHLELQLGHCEKVQLILQLRPAVQHLQPQGLRLCGGGSGGLTRLCNAGGPSR